MGYLSQSVPERLLAVAQAMRYGLSVEEIHRATQIDLWFLRQIAELVDAEAGLRRDGLPRERRALLRLKSMSFSDARLAFFFSSRRRHTRLTCDWSSDVCSSD